DCDLRPRLAAFPSGGHTAPPIQPPSVWRRADRYGRLRFEVPAGGRVESECRGYSIGYDVSRQRRAPIVRVTCGGGGSQERLKKMKSAQQLAISNRTYEERRSSWLSSFELTVPYAPETLS